MLSHQSKDREGDYCRWIGIAPCKTISTTFSNLERNKWIVQRLFHRTRLRFNWNFLPISPTSNTTTTNRTPPYNDHGSNPIVSESHHFNFFFSSIGCIFLAGSRAAVRAPGTERRCVSIQMKQTDLGNESWTSTPTHNWNTETGTWVGWSDRNRSR